MRHRVAHTKAVENLLVCKPPLGRLARRLARGCSAAGAEDVSLQLCLPARVLSRVVLSPPARSAAHHDAHHHHVRTCASSVWVDANANCHALMHDQGRSYGAKGETGEFVLLLFRRAALPSRARARHAPHLPGDRASGAAGMLWGSTLAAHAPACRLPRGLLVRSFLSGAGSIGHAFSRDCRAWTYSPVAAATTTVQHPDGSATTWVKRERPHLSFDKDMNMLAFFSGAATQSRPRVSTDPMLLVSLHCWHQHAHACARAPLPMTCWVPRGRHDGNRRERSTAAPLHLGQPQRQDSRLLRPGLYLRAAAPHQEQACPRPRPRCALTPRCESSMNELKFKLRALCSFSF